MGKLSSAVFYILHHPLFESDSRVDFSNFPSDQRLKSILGARTHKMTTPAFILDAGIVKQRYDTAKKEFHKYWKNVSIAYSFKTNYAPINIIRQLGGHAEVTSGRELRLALSRGYSGDKIVYNGPHKDMASLKTAIHKGVHIQADNVQELFDLGMLSKKMRVPVQIGCRLRLSGIGMPPSHFGMTHRDLFHADVLKLFKKHPHIRLRGVHFHAGTDVDNCQVFEQSARVAGETIQQLADENIHVDYVNCGGGVMSHARKPFGRRTWGAYDFSDYVRALWTGISTGYSRTEKLHVFIEPGRYLIDDAVVFAARVLRVKSERFKQTLYIDGTTAMLPLSQYRPQMIRSFSDSPSFRHAPVTPTIIFGATCREDDIPYRGWLTRVLQGDILIFYCAGAYNQSLGADFIFQKPDTHILPM